MEALDAHVLLYKLFMPRWLRQGNLSVANVEIASSRFLVNSLVCYLNVSIHEESA